MEQIERLNNGVPAYVKELINKIADREGFTEYSITHSAGSNIGDGFMSDLLRFKIKGQQNNLPTTLSLICKMPISKLLRREDTATDLSFSREIFLYEYVLPYFIQFQKENGISEADGFYSFPKCYGTILDAKLKGDHAIVMEDLLVNNYYLWDKRKNIDYERARLVMVELGKFHAVSFAIRDKNPEKLSEIRTQAFNDFHKTVYHSPTGLQFLNANVQKAIKALEPHETKIIEQLEAIKGNKRFEILAEIFSNLTPEPFGVVVHGDLWNNNVMYRNDDQGKPTKLMLFDWQMSQFGSPALDLTHYLFCSLDQTIRSEHYHEFVDCYYNSLVKTLRKFGCDDRKLFTLADLKDQFRRYGRTCLFAGPILCQIMTVDPADLPDMNVVAQPLQEAKESGETECSVDVFGKLSESFNPRIASLLRDCEREGVI